MGFVFSDRVCYDGCSIKDELVVVMMLVVSLVEGVYHAVFAKFVELYSLCNE